MTPGARIAASIALIEKITSAWAEGLKKPADATLNNYFKSHRYIGSKDRGSIAELTYFILRNYASLLWWLEHVNATPTPRLLVIAALLLHQRATQKDLKSWFVQAQYHPVPLNASEWNILLKLEGQELLHPHMPEYARLNYPAWLKEHVHHTFGEETEQAMRALNEEAPVDLRTNTLKTTREMLCEKLKQEGFDAEPLEAVPTAIRLAKRNAAFTTEAFKQGWFEMQDAGSQLVCQLVDAQPGQRVIDFCAGAGGKTLALSAAMKNKGRILAWDISEKRLAQITPRIRRAGADNIQTHVITSEQDAFIKRHKYSADRVVIDAPCSGSGTWRRNPDLKWRFTPEDLQELTTLQQRILQSAARLVKPGGKLIYITCSWLENENESQIEAFVNKSKNFVVVSPEKIWDKFSTKNNNKNTLPSLRLIPHQDGCDGFFAAVLECLGKEPS